MATIHIPKNAQPGFKTILSLNDEQVEQISNYLEKLEAEPRLAKFAEFLDSIKVSSYHEFITTLMSFSELISSKNVVFEKLTENLAQSYKELVQPDLAGAKQKKLQNYLYRILTHSDKLKLVIKASELFNEEDKVFENSRIVTDIRIVFEDDLNRTERNALIIHHLNINYSNNDREEKKIIVSISIDGLKALKTDIERAIKKEEIIRQDYKPTFNLLNFNNDD